MSADAPRRRRGPIIAAAVLAAVLVIALVVVVVLMVTGRDGAINVATPPPTTAPASPSAVVPTATASPTLPPAAFVMPECSSMRTDYVAGMIADESMNETADDDPATIADRLPGPTAAATVLASPQTRHCRWAIPDSDGIWTVSIAEIADADWDALASSLVADGWSPIEQAGATGYTLRWEQPTINDEFTTWIYLRVGEALVIAGPEVLEHDLLVLEAAVAAVRSANP